MHLVLKANPCSSRLSVALSSVGSSSWSNKYRALSSTLPVYRGSAAAVHLSKEGRNGHEESGVWISSYCHLMQSPGAEDFAALSVVWEPHRAPEFRSRVVDPVAELIGRELQGHPGRVTLVGLLVHEVDSRVSTFRRLAHQLLEGLEDGDEASAPEWDAEFPADGSWLVREPSTQGCPPPCLLGTQVFWRRPGVLARVRGWVHGDTVTWTCLEGPEGSLERARKLALWQARSLIFGKP